MNTSLATVMRLWQSVLTEPVLEYAMGDDVAKTLRDPAAANVAQLSILLMFHNRIKSMISRQHNFAGLAGIPMIGYNTVVLLYSSLSYAAWKLKQDPVAIRYLDQLQQFRTVPKEIKGYFSCVAMYLKLTGSGVPQDQVRLILGKFHAAEYVTELYRRLDSGASPYDGYLLKCDLSSCDTCRYHSCCTYDRLKEIVGAAGERYSHFADGQNKEQFSI